MVIKMNNSVLYDITNLLSKLMFHVSPKQRTEVTGLCSSCFNQINDFARYYQIIIISLLHKKASLLVCLCLSISIIKLKALK